jgi:hypothetical protein
MITTSDVVIVIGLTPSAMLAVVLIAAGGMELWALLQR